MFEPWNVQYPDVHAFGMHTVHHHFIGDLHIRMNQSIMCLKLDSMLELCMIIPMEMIVLTSFEEKKIVMTEHIHTRFQVIHFVISKSKSISQICIQQQVMDILSLLLIHSNTDLNLDNCQVREIVCI